jgi:hypothetical protein
MKLRDLTGDRFGRLIVIKRVADRNKRVWWRVRCDCGITKEISSNGLKSGHSKSCGCLRKDLGKVKNLNHGHASLLNGFTPTYLAWQAMRQRCRPSYFESKYYHDKGIVVCERWNNFLNFLSDMGERPKGMTLDRISSNGNYEPSNCRWATTHEQRINRSRSNESNNPI